MCGFLHVNTYTYISIYIWIYTRIYTYTYIHIYIYRHRDTHTDTHTHVYINMCIFAGKYIYIYIYIYMHTYTYIYIYICMYIHMYTCTYIYIYTYIYAQVHIHTCICTHTHTFPSPPSCYFPAQVLDLVWGRVPKLGPGGSLETSLSVSESRNITFCFGVSKCHFLFRSLEMSLSVPHDAFCSARRFLFRTSLCVSHVTLCCAPCASRLALRIGRCVSLVPPQPPFSLISLGSSGSMSSGSCTIPASVMTLVLRFCRGAWCP